jgi:pimeloyl-ACP methyl ester carboxylesterase
MSYATRYPDHPSKLVLASTTARRNLNYQLDMYERLGGPQAREVAQRFLVDEDRSAQAEWIKTCAPLNAKYTWSDEELARLEDCGDVMAHWVRGEGRTFDLLPELPRINCPTLLIGGRDDPLAPPAAMTDILDSLTPGLGRLEIVDNAGHGVCRDAPDTFFTLVRDFIREDVA